jgi:membrane protein DedA with SNARE-associated domain
LVLGYLNFMFPKLKKLTSRDTVMIFFSLLVSLFSLFLLLIFSFDTDQYAGLGYLGIILTNILTSTAIYSPVPAWLVSLRAAQFLNPYLIILVSALTVTCGEFTKYFFGDGVEVWVADRKWHKFLKGLFLRAPFLFMVIWVALPNPIQSLGEAFAGSTNYSIRRYFLATFIGNCIWFTLVVFAGRILLGVG